jgi:cation diffusion facilitator CzcD-associated flavoprotein CzcO
MHTAAWDSTMQLSGKKVAVVGTGASAIQVIPHLQQEAAELVVFQVSTCTYVFICFSQCA